MDLYEQFFIYSLVVGVCYLTYKTLSACNKECDQATDCLVEFADHLDRLNNNYRHATWHADVDTTTKDIGGDVDGA